MLETVAEYCPNQYSADLIFAGGLSNMGNRVPNLIRGVTANKKRKEPGGSMEVDPSDPAKTGPMHKRASDGYNSGVSSC
jgi:hypothetical protein